jgi:hypothetical protein
MNFGFNLFLLLPLLALLPRALSFAAGASVVLGLGWARNLQAIREHSYLFTWDGLATPASRFDPISTLSVQFHPDVTAGLRQLHDMILPVAEWLQPGPEMAFLALGLACVIASRRFAPALVVGSALLFFLLVDNAGSGRFFRVWTGILPALFGGIALIVEQLARWQGWKGGVAGAALVAAAVAAGGAAWIPPRGASATLDSRAGTRLEHVTPPSGLLTEERYMVNSIYYHPESLVYRFPDKEFIGLPLDAKDFDDFQRHFPEYRTLLWHEVSIQDKLLGALLRSGRFRPSRRAKNAAGRTYTVLTRAEER